MATIKSGDIPAITQEILAKLKTKGFQRVADFIASKPEQITTVSGLHHKKVLAIRRLLLAQFSSFPVTGADLYEESLNTTSVLSTSCPHLDHLLTGGFYTGEVTEICGPTSTGKTQLCMTWALNVAIEFDQNVIYIDSTGSASPRRFADIINQRHSNNQSGNASFSKILSKIRIVKCCHLRELKSLMREIESEITSTNQDQASSAGSAVAVKGVVIDSITPLLMPMFFTDTYLEGNASVEEMGSLLTTFSRDYSVAVLLVNDMVSSKGATSTNDFCYGRKAALGHTWSHVPSVRLHLSLHPQCTSSKGNHQTLADEEVPILVHLLKSSHRIGSAEGSPPQVELKVTSAGVCDLNSKSS